MYESWTELDYHITSVPGENAFEARLLRGLNTALVHESVSFASFAQAYSVDTEATNKSRTVRVTDGVRAGGGGGAAQDAASAGRQPTVRQGVRGHGDLKTLSPRLLEAAWLQWSFMLWWWTAQPGSFDDLNFRSLFVADQLHGYLLANADCTDELLRLWMIHVCPGQAQCGGSIVLDAQQKNVRSICACLNGTHDGLKIVASREVGKVCLGCPMTPARCAHIDLGYGEMKGLRLQADK